jgi:hypothetical protein
MNTRRRVFHRSRSRPDPLKLGAAEIALKPFERLKVIDVAHRYYGVGAVA